MSADTVEKLGQIFLIKADTLQAISMDFHSCDSIDDETLVKLGQMLSSPQNKIKSFKLRLSSIGNFRYEGLPELFKAIGRFFVDLEELSLRILDCRGVDDRAIRALHREIAGKNRKLKKVDILIHSCRQPTSQAFDELKERFAYLGEDFTFESVD